MIRDSRYIVDRLIHKKCSKDERLGRKIRSNNGMHHRDGRLRVRIFYRLQLMTCCSSGEIARNNIVLTRSSYLRDVVVHEKS